MAITTFMYASILDDDDAEVAWGGTPTVMLLADTYTPNQLAHDFLDDVNSHEVSGTGYTAGGEVVPTPAVTRVDLEVRFTGGTVEWDPSTVTARYAVVFHDTATPGTSPLIMLIDFGENLSSSSSPFRVIPTDANGSWFTKLTDGA